MYKFLVCRPEADGNDWCFSFNDKMYPDWNASVKEAILVGYFSRKQDKVITSGTAIHVRENYQNVKKAMTDAELSLIILGIDKILDSKDMLYNYSSHSFWNQVVN